MNIRRVTSQVADMKEKVYCWSTLSLLSSRTMYTFSLASAREWYVKSMLGSGTCNRLLVLLVIVDLVVPEEGLLCD
jgi:hypothetical protein